MGLLPGDLGRHAGMTRNQRTRNLARLAQNARSSTASAAHLLRGDLGQFAGLTRAERQEYLDGIARHARSPGPLLYDRTLADQMHAKKMTNRLKARGGTSRWHTASVKALEQQQRELAAVLRRLSAPAAAAAARARRRQ